MSLHPVPYMGPYPHLRTNSPDYKSASYSNMFKYKPTTLKTLNDEQADIAEKHYKKSSKTDTLDISVKTRDDCFEQLWLIKYLLDNIIVQNINISGCGYYSVDHLLRNCERQLAIIQCLNISHNNIEDCGLTWLAKVISDKRMPNLKELILRYNRIRNYSEFEEAYETRIEYSIPDFTDALVKHDTIETLVFSGNNMSAVVNGAGCIANVLKKNTTLENLEIRNCKITPGGAKKIAEALTCSQLRTLVISENNIGDNGVLAFAEALKVNNFLTELDISYCNVDDAGCVKLAEALKDNVNSGLMTLILKNNLITDIGAKALLDLLNTNTNLKKIDIGGNESIKNTKIAVEIDAKLVKEVLSRGRAFYV